MRTSVCILSVVIKWVNTLKKTFIHIRCVLWEILRVKGFAFLGLTAIRKDFKLHNIGELLSSIKGTFGVNLSQFY